MEVGTAYVRIRPQMSSFKAETQSGVRSAFSTVGKILLPTLAFAGITEGVRKSVQAAEVKQVISGQLENAFRTAGLSYRQYQSVVEGTLKQQEKLGFTFDDSAQSLGRAVRATRSVATATKLQSTAANLARGQNIGLLQATQILIRAYNGQTTGLKRLGVETSKHAKGVQVLDAVNRRFAGASAKYAETAAGSQAHLSAAVEETEALIGGALTPTVTKLNTRLADWLENSDNQRKIQEKVNAVVSVSGNLIHKITSAYETLAPPIKAVVDLLGGFGNVAQKALVIGLALKARDVLTSFKAVAAESETMADSIKVGSGKAETALAGTGEAGQRAVSLWDRALVGVGSRLTGVSVAAANTSTKVVASEEKQTAAISAKNTAISEQGTIADRAATQAAAAAERETRAYTVAADAVARKNELLASQGALAAKAAKVAPVAAPAAPVRAAPAPVAAPVAAPVRTAPANLAPARLSAAASGSAIAASATAELAFVSIFEQSLQDLAQSAATATTSSVAEIAAELGQKATETLNASRELADANKLTGKTATQAAAAYKLQGDAAATGATKATTAFKTQAAAEGAAALAAGGLAKPLMVSEEAIALSMAEAAKQASALKPPLVDAEAATRGVAAAAGTIVAPFAAAGRAITGLAAKLAAERAALFAEEAQGSLKTLDHRTPHRRKIFYDPSEEEALKRQTAATQGLAAASGTALARPLLAAEKQVKKIGALTAAEIARSKELGHIASSSAGAIGTQNSERLFASITERNAAVAASYQKFSRRQIREMVLSENPAQAAKFAAAQGLPSLRPGHVTGPRADTLFRQNELERKKREELMLPRASAVNAGFNEGFWRELDARQVRASAAMEDLFRNQKTRGTRLLALEGELSGNRGPIPFTAKNARVEPSNLTGSLRAGLITQKQWVQGWVDAVRRGTISATGFSTSMKSVMERGAITQAELVAVTTAVEREAAAMSKASTANRVAAAQAEIFQRAEAGVIVSLAEVQAYVAEGSVGLNKLALAQSAVNAQTRSLAAATKVLAEAGAAIPIEALTTASAQAAVSQENISKALGQTTKAAAPAAKGVGKVAAAWGAASRGAQVALPLMTTAENANTVAVERNAAANSMRLGGLTAPWLTRRVAVEADSAAVDRNSLALKGNATAADIDTAATDLNAAAQTRRAGALDKLRLAAARSLFRRGGLPTSGPGAPPVPAGATLGALTRGGVSGLLRSGLGVAIKSFNVGLTAYIANSLIQSFTGVDVIGGITRGISHALSRSSAAEQFKKAQDQFVATGGNGLKQLQIDAQLAKRAVNDNEKAVAGLKQGTTSYLEAEQRLLTSQDDYRSKIGAARAATVKHREAVETLAAALANAKGSSALASNELATSALKAADAARIDRTELAHLSKGTGAYAEVQRRLARDTGIYKNLLGGLGGEERAQVTRLAALSGAARDAADKYEQWRAGADHLVQGMKNVDPVLAHNLGLLVKFSDQTKEIPSEKQFSLVVNDRQALGSLHELMRLLEREIPADARVAASAISNAFGGIQFKGLATGAPTPGFGSLATNVRKFLPPRSKLNQAEIDRAAAEATGDSKKIRAATASELKVVEGTIAYLHAQTPKSLKAREKQDTALKNFLGLEQQLRGTVTGIDTAAAQKAKSARDEAARKAKAARDKAAREAKAAAAKALRQYESNIADQEGSLHRAAAATRKAVLRAVNLGKITSRETARLTTLPGADEGLLQRGNLDLNHRKVAKLAKGAIATVRSTSFNLADLVEGADKDVRARFSKLAHTSPHAEVLLPTVIKGRLVSNTKAIEQFRKTGQNLGVFKTIADANAYAERLHTEQDKFYNTLGKGKTPPSSLIAKLREQDQAEIDFYSGLAKTGKTAALRRHAKDELQKAQNQEEADNKAITEAVTKRADNLLNLQLTLADLAAKQGRGSEAKVEALQQQVDDRQKKILRDQIATFTTRANNASLGAAAQASAAAKANDAEDKLLALGKTEADRRAQNLSLSVQQAEYNVDAAGKNKSKLAKANAGLKAALKALIKFDQTESKDFGIAADERARYKGETLANKKKLLDLGKNAAGASGLSMNDLYSQAISDFKTYGSNIAQAGGILAPQDVRALYDADLAKSIRKIASKKHPPMVVQHFYGTPNQQRAFAEAKTAAEHLYIGA